MSLVRHILPLWLMLSAIAGCTAIVRQDKSLLMPTQMSSDSVALDVFFIRYPSDAQVDEKIWDEIDEQQFSPEVRERWDRNGFRVGIINGQLPMELSKLMELSDKPAPDGKIEMSNIKEFEDEPRVTRRHLQLPKGQRSEILASSVYEQLPVLLSENGQISGQTYNQAQGVFALKSYPQPEGRTKLELAPELQYGQSRQQYVPKQGMWQMDIARPKREFKDMSISATISSGSCLVLSSLSNRPGSLGHHFFAAGKEHLERKLLLVRLSQTQSDDLFAAPKTK
jgi:hypothetical protein